MLLTATPYNKAFTDAAGQLRLWLAEDADVGVRPERLITEQGELAVSRRADGRLTTLKAFEASEYPEDWQRLMSLFLVRRTRRFVEQQYGEEDADGRQLLRFADGEPFYFPTRLPEPLPYDGGPDDPGDKLASPETVDQLNGLLLARYRLGNFLVEGVEPTTDAERDLLERLGRSRGNLLGFIRTSLMKRLASCGYSFVLSVERHLQRTHVLLYALENGLPAPLGTVEDRRWESFSDLDETTLDGLDVEATTASGRTPEQWGGRREVALRGACGSTAREPELALRGLLQAGATRRSAHRHRDPAEPAR